MTSQEIAPTINALAEKLDPYLTPRSEGVV